MLTIHSQLKIKNSKYTVTYFLVQETTRIYFFRYKCTCLYIHKTKLVYSGFFCEVGLRGEPHPCFLLYIHVYF